MNTVIKPRIQKARDRMNGAKLVVPENNFHATMPPDEFVLRQWRTLVRMVRDMQARYGFKLESDEN
jgi:hypothetical protein